MKRVTFFTTEDGDLKESTDWHLSNNTGDAERALCSGQVYEEGESTIEYKSEEVKTLRSITCPACLDIVKWFKSLPK